MVSNETAAVGRLRRLGADYVMINFGGVIGSLNDDMSKFLWMVRLAGSTDASFKVSTMYCFFLYEKHRVLGE